MGGKTSDVMSYFRMAHIHRPPLRVAAALVLTQHQMLEQAHADHAPIAPITEILIHQHAFLLEAKRLVDVDGGRIVHIHQQIHLVKIEHAKRIVDGHIGRGLGKTLALEFRRDHDQKFGASMQMINFHKLDHANRFLLVVLHDEASLALVVDVLAVKLFELHEGFIGLLEPVAHHAAIVVEQVDKVQVSALQGPQGGFGVFFVLFLGVGIGFHAPIMSRDQAMSIQPMHSGCSGLWCCYTCKMADPLKKNPLEVLVFKISSPCGRVYELPLKKVQDDYVAYLVEADKISPFQAMQEMSKDDVHSWFMEQFNWDDVDRYATLVKEPSAKQIQAALDAMRNGTYAPDNAKLQISPKLAADFEAAQLSQSTPPSSSKPSRRRRV
jgi:hypothetical protein